MEKSISLRNSVSFSLEKQRDLSKKTIIKFPLRYPRGKNRAVPMIIDKYIKEQKTLCSPFLGGGSIIVMGLRYGKQ
ncbi:hypothetical protein [Bartonella pachyuromydis]|uniref:Site-specific DNA-methyltransferase (adenine-specific) n=1 Tax=Bartonella pachyuromydis TaxID=931097 RepID=A0ABP8VIC3_9HYPH